MYQPYRIPSWARALAIIGGLFSLALGITVLFFPAVVVGLVTVLFSVAFILLGIQAVALGFSGGGMTRVEPERPARATTAEERTA